MFFSSSWKSILCYWPCPVFFFLKKHTLFTGVILKGLTLWKFVSGVSCLQGGWFSFVDWFRVCKVVGFLLWIDLTEGWYICEKSLEMFICLWLEFDCPEVTLCGWQDIIIQLLLLLLALFTQLSRRDALNILGKGFFRLLAKIWLFESEQARFLSAQVYRFCCHSPCVKRGFLEAFMTS